MVLVWLVTSRDNEETDVQDVSGADTATKKSSDERPNSDKQQIDPPGNTPVTDETGEVAGVITPEPLDIYEWRMSRGYYANGSNDAGAKHPYEYYDNETLEQQALNDDGLAQLMLGERLRFSTNQKERAEQFYRQAAINGFTAGLINTAADRMAIDLKSGSYDFPTIDEDDEISNEYAERLKYFAAAEYLGDFVGSVSLRMHLDPSGTGGSAASRKRVCQAGFELADQIEAERIRKFGEPTFDVDLEILSFEIPQRFCSP